MNRDYDRHTRLCKSANKATGGGSRMSISHQDCNSEWVECQVVPDFWYQGIFRLGMEDQTLHSMLA